MKHDIDVDDVQRIIAAMRSDLTASPPPPDVAAVMPMQDAMTLLRVAEACIAVRDKLTIEQVIAACAAAYGTSLGDGILIHEAADGYREGASAALRVSSEIAVDGKMVVYADTAEAAIQQLGRDAIEVIRKQRAAADLALRALGVEP